MQPVRTKHLLVYTDYMSLEAIISEIDNEISHLRQVRALLSSNQVQVKATVGTRPARKRRKMSADARKRIAEAQRKRWAKQKAAK